MTSKHIDQISILGKASTKGQETTLKQIRCHVNYLTKTMMNTIEVPNDDEKNFGSDLSNINTTGRDNIVKVNKELINSLCIVAFILIYIYIYIYICLDVYKS